MGKQSNRPKVKERCAYCGIHPWTEREHVVTKQLFPDPLPKIMVTVGSCEECNDRKKLCDDYLRDMLLSDIDTSSSLAAEELRGDNFKKCLERHQSVLAREAIPTIRFEALHTPAGVYLGHFPTYRLDGERVRAAFGYIVRGLYFKLRKKRIPDGYTFEVARLDRFHQARFFHESVRNDPTHFRRLGEGVFDCLFYFAQEDEFTTFWIFRFYDSVVITVSTEPPGGIEALLAARLESLATPNPVR